jgi:putative peptidoglycan lipid II flippase
MAASALLAAVSWVVWRLLDDLFGTSLIGQLISVGGAAGAGGLIYARAVLAMRIPEAHQVSQMIRAQLGRA